MKLCFSTLCCLEADYHKVIEYALQNGFDGVEVRVNDKGKTFGSYSIEHAGKIKKEFIDTGLKISDLALSCNIKEYDIKQLQIGFSGIDFADSIGTKAVRIFVGSHQDKITDKPNMDYLGIIKAVKELSTYGKEKNIEVWLETHSSFSSGKSMKELVDDINCDNVKVIWDVIHSMEYKESITETFKYLGDKIVHIHFKDGVPSSDSLSTQFIHTDLGKGIVPSFDVVNMLNKSGYKGYYSLEWESPWRDEIREIYKDVNDLLQNYKKFIGC